jgi:hypothetical protein
MLGRSELLRSRPGCFTFGGKKVIIIIIQLTEEWMGPADVNVTVTIKAQCPHLESNFG